MKRHISLFTLTALLLVALSIVISGCSHQPNLAGKWVHEAITLEISNDGSNYVVRFSNPGADIKTLTFSGPFKVGKIVIGQPMYGDFTYLQERDVLLFFGMEFKRS